MTVVKAKRQDLEAMAATELQSTANGQPDTSYPTTCRQLSNTVRVTEMKMDAQHVFLPHQGGFEKSPIKQQFHVKNKKNKTVT